MRPEMTTDCSRTMSDTEQERISRKRPISTLLTEFQLSELKKRYKMSPYIKGEEKKTMARNLGITLTRIENWFRTRRKNEEKERGRP